MQFGEVHMYGRPSATRGGVVDNVIVNQRAGVQKLQCGEQQQGLLVDRIIGPGSHRAVTPVGEGRPEPLSAAHYEVLEYTDQTVVRGSDVAGFGPPSGQILPQLFGDCAGQLNG